MSDHDRRAAVSRETSETTIELTLDIDGDGDSEIDTGIGFFDHMLTSFAKHGLFDLTVRCDGDTHIDDHHTVEDVAICLGEAFAEALGDKRGIRRYADRRVPLDEAVASVVVDVAGRPYYAFEGTFSQESVGEFTSVMADHFALSLASNAGLTLRSSAATTPTTRSKRCSRRLHGLSTTQPGSTSAAATRRARRARSRPATRRPTGEAVFSHRRIVT